MRGVGDDDVTWKFTAIPDRAPTIALAKDPEAAGRAAALKLDYKVEDDYGVVDAKALFERKETGRQDAPPALRRARDGAGAAAGAHAQRRSARPPRISPSIRGPAST